MNNTSVTVGIIGCGAIANAAHLPAYAALPNAKIAYVCDIKKDRADAAAAKYGGKPVYSYRDVLADSSVTAVSICTPNDTHAEITVAALKAGKHVLCEKPAARTYAEAQTMLAACAETGMILNIGVVNRFNTAVNKIKTLIDEGVLGEVYHVVASFRAHRSIPGLGGPFTTKALSGGGVLIDWGVHYLDLIMYCLNDPAPVSVSGQTFSKLAADMRGYVFTDMWAGPPDYDGTYDVDDSVTALVRTDAATISLNGAWAQNIGVSETYIDFLGTKAGVRLQYCGNFKLYDVRNGMLIESAPTYKSDNMYNAEIAAFLDSVATGVKNTAHIEKTILTSRIMQGIYDSSETRREILFT